MISLLNLSFVLLYFSYLDFVLDIVEEASEDYREAVDYMMSRLVGYVAPSVLAAIEPKECQPGPVMRKNKYDKCYNEEAYRPTSHACYECRKTVDYKTLDQCLAHFTRVEQLEKSYICKYCYKQRQEENPGIP